MNNCVIFDTSYGSFNMGDYIINECANKELEKVFNSNFCVRIGTHTPVAHSYQLCKKRKPVQFINNAKYKFIIGTNIVKTSLIWPWPDWNVNIFNCSPYKNTILVGVGLSGNKKKANFYTRCMYKKMFSKDYIHSTRDERTKVFLEKLGFKAINTGCPTMWALTSDFCKKIPKSKSQNVVFTLTDYGMNKELDQKLIDILVRNYKNVYIWIQGSNDYDYFKSFNNIDNIKIVSPNVSSYHNFLESNDVDYVGTRLHAGIYALRHCRRTIILAIDNRARDMKETYNLNILEREKIDELDSIINSEFETNIKINTDNINRWKSQFFTSENN